MYYALIGQVYQQNPMGLILGFACKGKTVADVFLDYFRQTNWEERMIEGCLFPIVEVEDRCALYKRCVEKSSIPISELREWRSDILTETSATIAVTNVCPNWYKPAASDRQHILNSDEFIMFSIKELERLVDLAKKAGKKDKVDSVTSEIERLKSRRT